MKYYLQRQQNHTMKPRRKLHIDWDLIKIQQVKTKSMPVCSCLFVHTCVLMPCRSMYIWWRALKPGVFIHSQALCTDIDVHYTVLIKVNLLGDARLSAHMLWHYFSPGYHPSTNKLLLLFLSSRYKRACFLISTKLSLVVCPLKETGHPRWWWHLKRGRAEKEEVKNWLIVTLIITWSCVTFAIGFVVNKRR